jgi:serine/threonine protein kinase
MATNMKSSPEDIIAITIRRYLQSPSDVVFWNVYKKMNPVVPGKLVRHISSFITLEECSNRLMQQADEILFGYVKSLNGQSEFPLNEAIRTYEQRYFTANDNDFYNRIIYENEINSLKDELNKLKHDLAEAIEAKKSYISRDYQLVRVLGSGGFGKVSLVKHRLSEQLFAAKRLTDVDKEKQFIIHREIKALASITHPNIINYRNSFNVGSVLYLIMDYCAKGTLHDKIYKYGKLTEEELIILFLKLTEAFEYLHQKNIIHHDIKPSNLLIDQNDEIKISDFGCVNLSMGSRIFLPTEFYDNHYTPSIKTDIFALGVTLLEASLGYNPFNNKTEDEKNLLLKTANLPVNSLPYWLQNTILKATHYDPASRFVSMAEFKDSIRKRNIPHFLNKNLIQLEKDANRLSMLIRTKKWMKAKRFIEFHPGISTNLNLAVHAGTYYLNTHKLNEAERYFERALELNPHTSVEKLIAETYLQNGQATKASSVLTGYINRNFNDLEAHNQLLYSYFLSERWELGLEQAEYLLNMFPNEIIIKSNHALFCYLLRKEYMAAIPESDNAFGKYNHSVYHQNSPESWYQNQHPKLNDKLLFHEYKFKNIDKTKNNLELTIEGVTQKVPDSIITFGRKVYNYNTFSSFEGTSVSRRHFAIINMKNNVWLYDLNSTGVYVDGVKVNQKAFLLGLHKISFGDYELEIKTDEEKLM